MAALAMLLAPQFAAAQDVDAPTVIGGEPVVEIAAGGDTEGGGHSCARVQSGTVWCWGLNENGQLGDGTQQNRLLPVQVQGLTGATQIAVGASHSCALRTTGRVFCWGRNITGQLGDGTTIDRWTPVRVTALTDVVQIAQGDFHGCALRSSGRVFCWGANGSGQLGDGTNVPSSTPVRVSGPLSTGATQIGAGALHSCLLRQNGRVSCWGHNLYGQLGDATQISSQHPVQTQALSAVTQLAVGLYHTCALRSSGRVFCWGYNGSGAVGDGTSGENRPTPVRVRNLTSVTQIAAGGYWGHSCAVRSTGRVFCWGRNTEGQLGVGTNQSHSTPQRVVNLTGATQVTAGSYHTCGVRAGGLAFCWGWNGMGQLGDGTTEPRNAPGRVSY